MGNPLARFMVGGTTFIALQAGAPRALRGPITCDRSVRARTCHRAVDCVDAHGQDAPVPRVDRRRRSAAPGRLGSHCAGLVRLTPDPRRGQRHCAGCPRDCRTQRRARRFPCLDRRDGTWRLGGRAVTSPRTRIRNRVEHTNPELLELPRATPVPRLWRRRLRSRGPPPPGSRVSLGQWPQAIRAGAPSPSLRRRAIAVEISQVALACTPPACLGLAPLRRAA
jgi:hypothetical protein